MSKCEEKRGKGQVERVQKTFSSELLCLQGEIRRTISLMTYETRFAYFYIHLEIKLYFFFKRVGYIACYNRVLKTGLKRFYL